MSAFQGGLRRILADRHSPEAAAFFGTLLKYIHGRVGSVARGRCRGLLSETEVEEVTAEVLFQLMQGGLARFRGDSMPELLGFVRVICDRSAWRTAERRLRERDAVAVFQTTDDDVWTASGPRDADDAVDFEAASPLSPDDRDYLLALLRAGSKAELARQVGVSRAAVTQRIQRIKDRLDALSARDRAAHDAWLRRTAVDVLDDRGR